jgi:hypothetical protein
VPLHTTPSQKASHLYDVCMYVYVCTYMHVCIVHTVLYSVVRLEMRAARPAGTSSEVSYSITHLMLASTFSD